MKITTGYVATSKTKMPINITYICSKCGTENTAAQMLEFEQSVNGAVWSDMQKLKERAGEKLNESITHLFSDMEMRDYRKLKLTCKCKSCGHREPWSTYFPMDYVCGLYVRPLHTKNIFVAFLFLFAICFLAALFRNKPLIACCALVAITSPLLYGSIKNSLIQRKISHMDEKCLPHISVQMGKASGQSD